MTWPMYTTNVTNIYLLKTLERDKLILACNGRSVCGLLVTIDGLANCTCTFVNCFDLLSREVVNLGINT